MMLMIIVILNGIELKEYLFFYIKVLLIIYDGLKEDVATGPFYYISINVFI